jgi:hypothetical protein
MSLNLNAPISPEPDKTKKVHRPEPPQPNTITRSQATLICILLLFCTGLLTWHTFKSPQKWEYRIESIPDISFDSEINRLGAQGWEMVFARRASSGSDLSEKPTFSYEIIFKRPSQ